MDREMSALFLDLDGTLLNDQKQITAENRKAMEAALSHGVRILITSGRPMKSALLQARRMGLDAPGCYVIAWNGGAIYDCTQKKEIFHQNLRIEDLYTMVDEANRRGVYIQTYDGDDVVVERHNDSAIARRYCEAIDMEFRVIDDVRRDLSAPPPKALLIDFAGREKTEIMRRWIVESLAGRVDSFFSGPFYLEAVPAGINKGKALREVCGLLQIPVARTVAVGDEANDISMLQAAGTGIAMQNASPAVKAAADRVTQRDNNHDAIAEVIAQFRFPAP